MRTSLAYNYVLEADAVIWRTVSRILGNSLVILIWAGAFASSVIAADTNNNGLVAVKC